MNGFQLSAVGARKLVHFRKLTWLRRIDNVYKIRRL